MDSWTARDVEPPPLSEKSRSGNRERGAITQAKPGILASILLGIALLSHGCSGGDGVDLLPQSRFAEEFAAALCDSREPCCRESGVGFDRSQCIENLPSEKGPSLRPPRSRA